jgi:plastocyanin
VARLPIAFAASAALLLPLALTPAAAAPKVHVVVIDKLKFGPLPADLHVGDAIRWVNKDLFRHTATARNGSFNVDLQPGATGTMKLTRAGTIPFFCRYHPGMTGQLTVAK